MHANVKASTLTTELFQLLAKFQDLATKVYSVAHDSDAAPEFSAAVANLAAAYERLHACDLVVDAARDTKDQEYALPVGEDMTADEVEQLEG